MKEGAVNGTVVIGRSMNGWTVNGELYKGGLGRRAMKWMAVKREWRVNSKAVIG